MQDFIRDAEASSRSVRQYIIIPRQDAPLPRTRLASLVAELSDPEVSLISVIGSTDDPFALVVEMSEARFQEMTREHGEQFVISRDERVPEPPIIGPA
jgi:hypothetical protein